MITIKDLDVSYTRNNILHNLSLVLEEGKVHGLVGLNGTGKTTLLNTIYGIKKSEKGEIKFNGKLLKRRDISYLETENFFYPGITGYEYLSLFYNEKIKKELVEDLNGLFKLPLNRLIEEYSTGMKKKLAIIAVFLQDRKILILDEPYNGLDIESSKIVSLIIIKQKEKGKTIIITSHILETLAGICDVIHYLKDKEISFSKEKPDFNSLNKVIDKEIEEKYNLTIQKIFK